MRRTLFTIGAISRSFKVALVCSLMACTLLFFLWSWHWPLVGDASLIHYICFLMDHGMAPYRDLGDMNMPGVYMVEWAVMHTYGAGELAWRIFDFTLMAAAGVSIVVITLPDWFAGLFAASLFILVHGRDGLGQAGQRDLTMAVCLLMATASLMQGVRKDRWWGFALFGVFAGVAVTIKPTAPLFAALLLLVLVITYRRQNRRSIIDVASASAAFFIGPIAAVVFLWQKDALRAFIVGLSGIVPYYASLGHKSLGFLLAHSVSPLMSLVVIWLLLLLVSRPKLTPERVILVCGVAFGLFSYIVQQRGYPYYRYSLLAFLLPLMAMDFAAAFRSWQAQRVCYALAALGLLIGGFVIAPTSIFYIHRYETHADFITSLRATLEEAGGASLSGHIQCIDSISGCGTTLYKMRLVQSTGVLSDFLLFGPETAPVVRSTRRQLLEAIEEDPPKVIVVSASLHLDRLGNYRKLERWPEFSGVLSQKYLLKTEWSPHRPNHWWSREQWPDGYRVYVLRAQ
ncbi:glycosyltransferase family 39 protein [Edaphobacter sp. 12200R-103]|uniref:glycosyltransferase family 39 protein n=1 Tax=Edaphobacter sp. 12200R-103 TaxID=2703788 RepID=UPI00138B597F|nr:glycosyltransferase family 39 protein [Edaphobacter sp. 12200R-103]QHS51901.1 hypothetical protein GWR55_09235 [Edaphobacter sp. 12200R-103]